MRSQRLMSITAALLILLAGCAGGSPAATTDDPSTGEKAGSNDQTGSTGKGSKGNNPGGSGSGSGSGHKKSVRSGSEGGAGGQAAGPEGGEDDSSSSYYPAAGTYVYDQSGFEEFCDSSSCNKKDLPPTQDVKTTHKERSGDTVTVITEAESSDSRFTRTTTRYSPSNALITNVQVRFDYQGFKFDNSYQPDPPVESVRYPLRAGASWSGSWQDSTSGDYQIEVGAKQSVSVGGATVQAFPLRTITQFRGEFEGEADITVWIDPATAAIVKLEGELRVKSVFGRYNTEFEATLRSGPGY